MNQRNSVIYLLVIDAKAKTFYILNLKTNKFGYVTYKIKDNLFHLRYQIFALNISRAVRLNLEFNVSAQKLESPISKTHLNPI